MTQLAAFAAGPAAPEGVRATPEAAPAEPADPPAAEGEIRVAAVAPYATAPRPRPR
jgi:hypothetical protein